MNRNFALLGLREDATKEQVKAAYERRLAKYHAADYADDPAYAQRKIAELKEAYEKAYSAAGRGSVQVTGQAERSQSSAYADRSDASQRTAEEAQREKERQEKRQAYEKKRSHMDEEERHPLERFQLEKKPSKAIKKPDLSALKKKAEHLKNQGFDKRKQLRTQMKSENASVQAELSEEEKKLRSQDSYSQSDDKTEGLKAKAVIVIFILIIGLALNMCDGSSSDVYFDSENYYTDYYNEEDWNTSEYANDIRMLMYEEPLEYTVLDELSEQPVDREKLRKAANLFAKRYTNHETMSALCDDLWERAGAFSEGSNSGIVEQVTAVLEYYGFPSIEEFRGYISPYTEEPIDSLYDYLKFMNRYYKEELSD